MTKTVWIVTYIGHNDGAPIITVFSNEENARKCYGYFKENDLNPTIEKAPLYGTFRVTDQTGSGADRVKLASAKKGIEDFLAGSLLEIRPTEELISRKALLNALDGIYDCADMVFEPDDHCCKPEDCAGCKWVKTKNYIRKLVANAPTVSINNTKEENSMNTLTLATPVYVVCRLITDKDRVKIYVSRKEINRIERNQEGLVIYTAGKHNELRFCEVSEAHGMVSYRSMGLKQKNVYLSKELADEECQLRREEEKNRESEENK